MNIISIQASAYLLLLSARVLWRKWRKQAVAPVAELLDRMVLLIGIVDAFYYVPCMLVLMQVGGIWGWGCVCMTGDWGLGKGVVVV
jgi:hypothetical protein